jgi:hypothetical protein
MAKYYPLEKVHNQTKLRNWTIYATIASNRSKYKIYYIDSEWRTAGNDDNMTVNFSKLQTAFGDGIIWTLNAEQEDSNGTFQCIIVRVSDRKAIKCVGTASSQQLANQSLWECTDVTGSVWYDELGRLRLLGII